MNGSLTCAQIMKAKVVRETGAKIVLSSDWRSRLRCQFLSQVNCCLGHVPSAVCTVHTLGVLTVGAPEKAQLSIYTSCAESA